MYFTQISDHIEKHGQNKTHSKNSGAALNSAKSGGGKTNWGQGLEYVLVRLVVGMCRDCESMIHVLWDEANKKMCWTPGVGWAEGGEEVGGGGWCSSEPCGSAHNHL